MQERLGLKRRPRRIECYDVSHIQGTAAVASMVVFVDGEPAKQEYRRFKLRADQNDDYAAMEEVLTRRLTAYLNEREQPVTDRRGGKFAYPPQLLLELETKQLEKLQL
jgi:excinuclease ABC subunit C